MVNYTYLLGAFKVQAHIILLYLPEIESVVNECNQKESPSLPWLSNRINKRRSLTWHLVEKIILIVRLFGVLVNRQQYNRKQNAHTHKQTKKQKTMFTPYFEIN